MTGTLKLACLFPSIGSAMIDLHTHSTASDGSFSPSLLMEEAAKRGISTVALTDHDTAAGLEEASLAARKLGIRFIPGIELEIIRNEGRASADLRSGQELAAEQNPAAGPGGEFHLLGLGINQPSPDFKSAVDELARRREERNIEIVDKMNKAGIAVSYGEIKAIAAGNEPDNQAHSVGRPHFASFLVERKIVRNMEQAFERYLAHGKPFYIPKTGLEFEHAARVIKESGGIAVLAHPMSLYVAWGRLPALVESLKERGLDGLEAWHPTAKVTACKRLEALGKKLGLCITAGSDFHGDSRRDRKLGITAGGKKIDDSFLEALSRIMS